MSLDKDLRRHHATLDALRELIGEFNGEAWERPGHGGGWCPAQVYSHIALIADGFSFKNLDACLKSEGRSGGRKSLVGFIVMGTNVIRASRRIKVAFPPELQPASPSREEAQWAMEGLVARAEAYAPRVAAADPARRSKHFLLGWMNAAEWFRFAEIHHRHHLEGQLQRLRTASRDASSLR